MADTEQTHIQAHRRLETVERWPFDDARRFVCGRCKILFTWIPKNAGRSLYKALAAKHIAHGGAGIVTPYSHLLAINPALPEFLHFAVRRNPWDRTVSCYYNKIVLSDPGKDKLRKRYPGLEGGMSFRAFVDWLASDLGQDKHADQHWASQYLFLQDGAGERIVTNLLQFENLADEVAGLPPKVGLNPRRLPHKNATERASDLECDVAGVQDSRRYRREYRDDEMIEKVALRYARDIELFSYEF